MKYNGGPEAARKRCIDKKYAEAPMILCACECGTEIKSINKHGRKRIYVNGHSNRKYKDPHEYKRQYLKRHKGELSWKKKKCGGREKLNS